MALSFARRRVAAMKTRQHREGISRVLVLQHDARHENADSKIWTLLRKFRPTIWCLPIVDSDRRKGGFGWLKIDYSAGGGRGIIESGNPQFSAVTQSYKPTWWIIKKRERERNKWISTETWVFLHHLKRVNFCLRKWNIVDLATPGSTHSFPVSLGTRSAALICIMQQPICAA